MNVTKVLKFVQSLPETVRCIIYVIYLLTYFLKAMKTFFIPKRSRFKPEEQLTSIPRETPDGIVHEVMSESDIHERFSADDAMAFDPANLVNNGIEPSVFGGSIISPLDANERLVDSFNGVDPSVYSASSSVSDSSSSESSATSESSN